MSTLDLRRPLISLRRDAAGALRSGGPVPGGATFMTRYREAFSWTDSVEAFVRFTVTERPLLNACAGRTTWGDVTLDLHETADVKGTWESLPFEDDSFGAVFADPPWDSGHKLEVANYMREALRVAPVAYLMAPWLYCAAWAKITRVWYREFPGVHAPILLSRYERSRQMTLPGEWSSVSP